LLYAPIDNVILRAQHISVCVDITASRCLCSSTRHLDIQVHNLDPCIQRSRHLNTCIWSKFFVDRGTVDHFEAVCQRAAWAAAVSLGTNCPAER